MTIESLTDWNARIVMCECCFMPEHPAPREEYESTDFDPPDKWGWVQFTLPPGEPADPLPQLFAIRATIGPNLLQHGTRQLYEGWYYNIGTAEYFERLTIHTLTAVGDVQVVDETVVTGFTSTNSSHSPVTPFGPNPSFSWLISNAGVVETIDTPLAFTITESRWRRDDEKVLRQYPTPLPAEAPSLQGEGGTRSETIRYINYTVGGMFEVNLSEPFTEETLIAIGIALFPTIWPNPATGNLNSSRTSTYWPTIGYYLPWLPDSQVYQERKWQAGVHLRKMRVRFGIPDGYSTPYFKVEWDEVLFPVDTSTPSSLVAARSWEYDGESPFSDWFEVMSPAIEGTVELRNIRSSSYRSPWGNKPSYHGERWTPPG